MTTSILERWRLAGRGAAAIISHRATLEAQQKLAEKEAEPAPMP